MVRDGLDSNAKRGQVFGSMYNVGEGRDVVRTVAYFLVIFFVLLFFFDIMRYLF